MATEGAVIDKAADAGAAKTEAAAGAAKDGAAAGGDAAAKAASDAAAAAGAKKDDSVAAAKADAAKTDTTKKSSILGAAASKDGEKTKIEPQGAPEKYADFKLPEGVALGKDMIAKATDLFKKHGFSQEVAQELVNFQAQNLKAEIESSLSSLTQQSEAWAKESREQFGAAWEKGFADAAKGIESFGTPKMREILTAVGLDNHPEFVAMFAKVGAKLAEGQPVDGRTAGGERVPTEKLMFDKMEPKK